MFKRKPKIEKRLTTGYGSFSSVISLLHNLNVAAKYIRVVQAQFGIDIVMTYGNQEEYTKALKEFEEAMGALNK